MLMHTFFRFHEETSEASSDTGKSESTSLSNCDDIAIIGAGISGTYAAWRLREKNMKISMYEYSNRIGGRCFTVQLPGIPDVNVELGAMRFIPAIHPLLNKTVHDLGLEVIDFELGTGSSGETLYYLRGKHMRYSELPTEAPYSLPPENRVDPDILNWNVFKNFTMSSQNGDVLKSLDGVPLYLQSCDMYMDKYLDIETVQHIKDSANFKSIHGPHVSAGEYIPVSDPRLPSSAPNAVKTVRQGFQAIPEELTEQFLSSSDRHHFYRNRHLRAITKQSDGSYVLTFKPTETKAGITTDIKDHSGIKTCAKKVILAIPRIALEYLDWEGLTQATIQDYIKHSVKEVHAGKMYFGYETAWWRQIYKASSYAVSFTPLQQTYDFAVSNSTSRAVLNPGYPDGDTRIWREAVSTGERVQGVGDDSIAMTHVSVHLARKYFAEIFNITMTEVPEPDSAVMSIWDQYPIAAAWYVWAPGYKWEEVQSRMIKPSGNDEVYIASNVFSSPRKSWWTEGGLEMAEKVLRKIFETALEQNTLEFYEHQGTHIDAPVHFGNGRQSLEQIPPEKLMGPGVVIDIKDKVKNNADYAVTVEDIKMSHVEFATPYPKKEHGNRIKRFLLEESRVTTPPITHETLVPPDCFDGSFFGQPKVLGQLDAIKLCRHCAVKEDVLYFPYPGDTTKYIECDANGGGFLKDCPPSTIWNVTNNACSIGKPSGSLTTTLDPGWLLKTTSQTKVESSVYSKATSSSTPFYTSWGTLVYSATSPPPLLTGSKTSTKHTSDRFTPAPTPGQNGLFCHTCTDEAHCSTTKCQATEPYCINIVRVNSNGSQTVVKKSCANLYECKYDHSQRDSPCGTLRNTSSSTLTNNSITCQLCCTGTNVPCNTDTIPAQINWFQDISTSTPRIQDNVTTADSNTPTKPSSTFTYNVSYSPNATSSTGPSQNTSLPRVSTAKLYSTSADNLIKTSNTLSPSNDSNTASSTTYNVYYSPNASIHSGLSQNTSLPTISTTKTISTSADFSIKSSSTLPPSSNSNIASSATSSPGISLFKRNITTIQRTLKSSTSPPVKTTKGKPYTLPPKTTKCQVCNGPDFLCEKLFVEKDCVPPNNYCVNTVSNQRNGSRLVNRRCDNFATCYRDWYLGSSDSDKCRKFDQNQILTLEFDCTYCCITDGCNLPLRPSDSTLYKDL